jgi:hypothetical protein
MFGLFSQPHNIIIIRYVLHSTRWTSTVSTNCEGMMQVSNYQMCRFNCTIWHMNLTHNTCWLTACFLDPRRSPDSRRDGFLKAEGNKDPDTDPCERMKFKKAPDAPKRFKSAFIFFSSEKHKTIRAQLEAGGVAAKVIATLCQLECLIMSKLQKTNTLWYCGSIIW